MSYDLLIEKTAEADTESGLLDHALSCAGMETDGAAVRIATLLRLNGIDGEQVGDLADTLSLDGAVKVNALSLEHAADNMTLLSRRNGVISATADLAYKILLLKYPKLSNTLKIKEYVVITSEGDNAKAKVSSAVELLMSTGEYRRLVPTELESMPESDDLADEEGKHRKRKPQSLDARENPELSEPFSTVASKMIMNRYGNRTFEDMKKLSVLEARSGEKTVYLGTEYSELEKQLKTLDINLGIDDASAAQSYFLAESREPTEMELRIITRCRSERWAHHALNTSISVSEYGDQNVRDTIESFEAKCHELDIDPDRATLDDMVKAPLKLRYKYAADGYDGAQNDAEVPFPVPIDEDNNGIMISTDRGSRAIVFTPESNNTKTSVDPASGATGCLGASLRKALRMNAYPYDVLRLSGIASPFDRSRDGEGGSIDKDATEQRMLARSSMDSFSAYSRAVGVPCSSNFEYISDRFSLKHMEVSAAFSVSDGIPSDLSVAAGDAIMILGSRTGRDGRVYRRYLKITAELLKNKLAADGRLNEGRDDLSPDKLSEALGVNVEKHLRSELIELENFILENGEELCGEAVPSGDSLLQKKLVELCSSAEFKKTVKKLRDVDSSGVVTAVAALANGVELYLDCIPLKYNGMSATEVAFSETCERMVAVVDKNHMESFIEFCVSHGVICAAIGEVTDDGHLDVFGGGKRIAHLSGAFLFENDSERRLEAKIAAPAPLGESEVLKIALRPIKEVPTLRRLFSKPTADHAAAFESIAERANVKTAVRMRRFDNTVNEVTGISHMTREFAPVSVAYVRDREGILTKDGVKLCSAVSIGMHNGICEADPYRGAYYAVTDAICRLVASGVSHRNIYTAIQLFHPAYRNDEEQTGDTLAAVAGAYEAQVKLGAPVICGDFSLGGVIDVDAKPAVAVFGISVGKETEFCSSGFKRAGSKLALFKPEIGKNGLPTYSSQIEVFNKVEKLFKENKAYSAVALTGMSLAEGVMYMCIGADGEYGFEIADDCTPEELYGTLYGAIAVEVDPEADIPRSVLFGTVADKPEISAKHRAIEKSDSSEAEHTAESSESNNEGDVVVDNGEVSISVAYLKNICYGDISGVYENTPFEKVAERFSAREVNSDALEYTGTARLDSLGEVRRERMILAPKRNMPYTTLHQPLVALGADVRITVPCFNGSIGAERLTRVLYEQADGKRIAVEPFKCSVDKVAADELAKRILQSGMLCIPDNTESASLLAAMLEYPSVAKAIERLRDAGGLVYGCGAGFSALIQTGHVGDALSLSGRIEGLAVAQNPLSGLTRRPVAVKVLSDRSPFMALAEKGGVYRSEISSYRGRLIGDTDALAIAANDGIIATVYEETAHRSKCESNPCRSVLGIDSMTSADGTVFGQLSFPERADYYIDRNWAEYKPLPVLASAVKYLAE